MYIILAIILFILLIGLLPSWPYAVGWNLGYYPSGFVGLLFIILLVLLLTNRL